MPPAEPPPPRFEQALVELLFEPGVAAGLDASIQARAQDLINAQRAQSERLEAAINETRGHLDQLRSAQTNAQKLRPAYGTSPATASPSLSFAQEA